MSVRLPQASASTNVPDETPPWVSYQQSDVDVQGFKNVSFVYGDVAVTAKPGKTIQTSGGQCQLYPDGTIVGNIVRTTFLTANTAILNTLNANNATFNAFIANTAQVTNLTATTLISNSAQITNLTATTLISNTAQVTNLTATTLISNTAQVTNLTTTTLISNSAQVTNLTTTTLISNSANVTNLTTNTFVSNTAVFNTLVSNSVVTNVILANIVSANTAITNVLLSNTVYSNVMYASNVVSQIGYFNQIILPPAPGEPDDAAVVFGKVLGGAAMAGGALFLGSKLFNSVGKLWFNGDKLSDDFLEDLDNAYEERPGNASPIVPWNTVKGKPIALSSGLENRVGIQQAFIAGSIFREPNLSLTTDGSLKFDDPSNLSRLWVLDVLGQRANLKAVYGLPGVAGGSGVFTGEVGQLNNNAGYLGNGGFLSTTAGTLTVNGNVALGSGVLVSNLGSVQASAFIGNGALVTAINASAVSTGVLASARLEGNGYGLLDGNLAVVGGALVIGNASVAGNVAAGYFLGNAALMAGVANALPWSIGLGNVTAASVAAGALSGNGAGLAALNASELATGTLPGARLPPSIAVSGNLFAGGFLLGNGALLTGIGNAFSADQIVSGVLDPARIGGNLAVAGLAATGNISAGGFLLGNGAFLTGMAGAQIGNTIDASQVTSGVLNPARIAGNLSVQTLTAQNIVTTTTFRVGTPGAAFTTLRFGTFNVPGSTAYELVTTVGLGGVVMPNTGYRLYLTLNNILASVGESRDDYLNVQVRGKTTTAFTAAFWLFFDTIDGWPSGKYQLDWLLIG